ncbi:MAG: ATP-binding cassette domain-containing protein [Acholeplasma sp.]|nr:ATP-binding cassette domain-containing protein [Acholeplasma sp.]
MIELKGIGRTYRPKKGEPVKALNSVNLTFGTSGMVFVLGKSGSGKSTLLNVIGGLDKYDEGDLVIKGKSTKDFKQSDFDSYRNTMIGFIFQEYNVLDEFTVAQNIALAIELQGRKATNEEINNILKSVDLEGYGNRKPNELSGGQKQRVAIARALVKEPEVIMADEPTGALDSDTGKQVFETLQKLSKTRLVIVVSHDRDFAETYGSRIIEFKDGVITRDVSRDVKVSSTDESVVFDDEGITVSEGYQLTQKDLDVINEYLLAKDSKAFIKKRKSSASSLGSFNTTDDSLIVKSTESYTSIKSKLPFKSSLKIGASSLKHKTVRLVFSIILASLSFAMFGLTDSLGSYNQKNTAINSLIDSKVDYASFSKEKVTDRGNGWTQKRALNLSNVDLDKLQKIDSGLTFTPVLDGDTNGGLSYYNNVIENKKLGYSGYYISASTGITYLTDELITKNGFTKLAGGLPKKDGQIAITKYQYEIFKDLGMQVSTSGVMTEVKINNYNDILNKKIGNNDEYEIVGVIDTKFNHERYSVLKEDKSSDLGGIFLSQEFSELIGWSYHNLIFVTEDSFNVKVQNKGLNMSDLDGEFTLEVSDYSAYSMQYQIMYNDDLITNAIYFDGYSKDTFSKDKMLIRIPDYYINTIGEFIPNDMQDEYYEEKEAYVVSKIKSLTREQLYNELYRTSWKSIEDYINWDDEMYNYYVKELLDIIQSGFYFGTESLLKEQEIEFDFMNEFIKKNNLTIKAELAFNDYYTDEPIIKELTVVGFSRADDGYETKYIIDPLLISEMVNVDVSGKYKFAISSLESDRSIIKKAVDTHYSDGEIKYKLRNDVIVTLDLVSSTVETMAQVFLYMGIGFAVFASLLLINFIGTSVAYKKQEIGILRAIGARGRDVAGIFFKEATLIAMINFVIATILSGFAIYFINRTMRTDFGIQITILSFGIRQIALIIAISLFVAYISSALPVRKISRKRPIDAIRDK